MKGCIVRIKEESMHHDFLSNEGIPLVGLVIREELDDQDGEPYLVEFALESYVLHDGGRGDGMECRYWVDNELEVLERNPQDFAVDF